MVYFSDKEQVAFNSLEFDPTQKPYFDPMRYCLRWFDEEPSNLDSEGYEKLLDLVIARSFVHANKPRTEWYVLEKTTYFVDCWQAAEKEIPEWPGFIRKDLSENDRLYLQSALGSSPDDFF